MPAAQIFEQLNQLYNVLQSCYPDWCRDNPFWSLVSKCSDAELGNLAVRWKQWIDEYQARQCAPAPMADATRQQPTMGYFAQALSNNLDPQQPFDFSGCGWLSGDPQAIYGPGPQNRRQEAVPQQLNVRTGYEMVGHHQAITVPAPAPAPAPALALAPQAPLPPAAPPVEINGTFTLPAWLSLVRPKPKDQVITVRRECQVVLDIKFKELSSPPGPRPVTRRSLVVPSTANVRTEEHCSEGGLMHLSVRVFGADTNSEYKSVCDKCSKREGKKKGEPSLVDFHAASNVIKASDDGLVQIRFKFSCYPNHQNQNECAYLLEVALSENQHQGQMFSSRKVVATCRLPWHFKLGKPPVGQGAPTASASGTVPFQNETGSPSGQHAMAVDTPTPRPYARNELGAPTLEPLVPSSPGSFSLSEEEHQGVPYVPTSNTQAPVARGPSAHWVAGPTPRKRGRGEADLDDEDSQKTSEERRVRPRLEKRDNAPTGTAGSSAPPANLSRSRPFTAATGITPHGASSSNGSCNSPATSATPSAPQPDPSLRPVQRHQSPAQTVEQTTTVLCAANPRSGPVAGGVGIWLEVKDLPTTFTLYAKFGDKVTATTVRNLCTLSCVLPSASQAGRVQVTLSRSVYNGAPQYGTSVAEFVYLSDHASLIPILLRMEENGRPEFAPTLRAVVTLLQGDQALPGATNPQPEQIESSVLKALLSLREKTNFDDIVSTTNDSNQTLAHLSVLFGYISLLRHLVEWRIDLTVADISGLTALHCAYLKEDRESIRILLRGGADSSIEDKLGRIPRHLAPEGSELADWPDGEIGTREGSPPIQYPMDREIALGEQFTLLENEEDHDKDSGHGGSDSGSDESSNNGEDEEAQDIGSSTLEPGPSNSNVSTLDLMNQLLNSKKSRKKSGLRLIPDTPHDPAISAVAKKLQDTEADPVAIEFLCNGIFPDGTITLEALRAPMTVQEVAEFSVEEGTQKYRGLLSREREVFNCRLCPEEDKLDFKDPEEGLHHMTKDHFDMGYSCDCGCKETYWTSLDLKKHKRKPGIEGVQATAT